MRRALSDGVCIGEIVYLNRPLGIDVLKVISKIPNAEDPNAMIAGVVALALPWPLTSEQLAYLKEILIPGLPDFEWTVEYGAYLLDPTDDAKKMAVENRLRALFMAVLALPEFQLQ